MLKNLEAVLRDLAAYYSSDAQNVYSALGRKYDHSVLAKVDAEIHAYAVPKMLEDLVLYGSLAHMNIVSSDLVSVLEDANDVFVTNLGPRWRVR